LSICLLAALLGPAMTAGDTPSETKLEWQLNPLEIDGPIPYFISSGLEEYGYRPADAELAAWAFEHWARAAGGVLCFYPAIGSKALIRIYWSPVAEGRFGQMQSIAVGRRRGGEVYVRPEFDHLHESWAQIRVRASTDPLFRDSIVYLTLLHEVGHVLGLVHTANIEDAMYFGGDPLAYFERYRARIQDRDDIRRQSAVSTIDQGRLDLLYPPDFWRRAKALGDAVHAADKAASSKAKK
jgi:hypothetical protein